MFPVNSIYYQLTNSTKYINIQNRSAVSALLGSFFLNNAIFWYQNKYFCFIPVILLSWLCELTCVIMDLTVVIQNSLSSNIKF